MPLFVPALILLTPLGMVRATELLKDQHAEEAYVFDSDLSDVPGTIEEADAIKVGILMGISPILSESGAGQFSAKEIATKIRLPTCALRLLFM